MKASFVITAYNRVDGLERCLDSILNQDGCDTEIIVVDDASGDRTCSMVRKKYGSHVRLIVRDVNCGSVKNRNYGAQLAEGDVLFLVDDDTEFPGKKNGLRGVGGIQKSTCRSCSYTVLAKWAVEPLRTLLVR